MSVLTPTAPRCGGTVILPAPPPLPPRALDLRTWADKKSLSVSRLETLAECGRKAFYRYELPPHLRPPDPPSNALVEGTAVHAGVEFLRLLQLTGEPFTTPDAVTRAHTALDRAYDEEVRKQGGPQTITWAKKITPDQSRRLAHGGLDAYCFVSPRRGEPPLLQRLRPQAVEESFTVDIPNSGGWVLNGRIDVTADEGVFDVKFTGHAYYQRDVDQKMQLTAYPWEKFRQTGELIQTVGIHAVLKPSLPKGCRDISALAAYPPPDLKGYRTQEVVTRRTTADFAEFEDYLLEAIQQVESGVFTRDLEARWCAWCPFLTPCRGGTTFHRTVMESRGEFDDEA